jgi:transposase
MSLFRRPEKPRKMLLFNNSCGEPFSENKRALILELHKRHGIYQIARTVGASRLTVRRIIKSGTAQAPKISRPSTVEPYRAQILDLCSSCRGNWTRVHKELMAYGAQFSYSTLTHFVRQKSFSDALSNVTRSITAAQQWLTDIIHGSQSVETLERLINKEVHGSTDLAALLYAARNGRKLERKKAATILARKLGIPNTTISVILHSSPKTTRGYFKLYSEAGPSVLFGSSAHHSKTNDGDSEKTRNILEILHQKPALFGVNRTSWTQRALIRAYKERYRETISRSTVARLIKEAGYGWRKARRVLTSPDPNYREKVELLVKTLRSLGASELLFFLDEWGPVQVRKRGGKGYSAEDNIPRIPRNQTSRGAVALVAALSATTNQMTWTFVTSKDTRSMIGLLEMLYNQYHANARLYVTWDAVSWHNSPTLMAWLDRFNETSRKEGVGPIIELVPLPTSAQFLNVIEGVLSGMTRAVINNSDYSSPDDMKAAISRYFDERNTHFKNNPRRAGKKIWEMDFFHGLDAFRNVD